MKKGFTLIELLVVVLIIAILAAVALPQYTNAVEKSRATEALVIVKALRDAQVRHYLQNDSYAGNFESLDVSISGTAGAGCSDVSSQVSSSITTSANITYCVRDDGYVTAARQPDLLWGIDTFANPAANIILRCVAVMGTKGEGLCQSLTGDTNPVLGSGKGRYMFK
ncbi:prepilin-type N-terminal cleavage/methylation domain-containing protein [Parelusimicrobium proximum]|uniref:type IV pilin protein n=1 Tax=Parelusimicrobium proximum TaxID=3228953 RepID=UPI003D163B66